MFLNTGQQRFANVSAASSLDFSDDGRGIARVDWDLDGDLDLWICNRNGPIVRFLRNDVPNDHHFVAVRLRGRTCNVDAIGAKVEVVLEGENVFKNVKTLDAGDGYLSQSSKWLHFGLGSATRIKHVVVRWPGGEKESFSGVAADGRYVLVQGAGHAEPWNMPPRSVALRASTPSVPKPTDRLRVFSTARIPLPGLSYESFDGVKTDVLDRNGRPVLLSLWASWCRPCIEELTALGDAQESLRAAGLDVVAVSVDGLDGKGSRDAARGLVERLELPFAFGFVDTRFLDKLQLIHDHLVYLQRPLPVPASFLIDAQGRLAAMYKGPVEVSQVLADVRKLSLDQDARRNAAVPFAGRWLELPTTMPPEMLASTLIDEGFLRDAGEYIDRHLAQMRSRRRAALMMVRLARQHELHDQPKLGRERIGKAEKLDPELISTLAEAAVQLERRGRSPEAIGLYREALRRSPRNIIALNNLAWIMATHHDERLRDGAEAVELAKSAAEITNRTKAPALDTLAAAYAEAGEFRRAIATAEEAIRLAQAAKNKELARRIEQRLGGYRAGKPHRTIGF